MKKKLETVTDFKIKDDNMFIICKKYNIILPIIDGSVVMILTDENNKRIGINDINKDDRIIIYFRDIEELNIKPIKIIKLFNYIFNDETSDSEIY
jgi:hypothetical protein